MKNRMNEWKNDDIQRLVYRHIVGFVELIFGRIDVNVLW